MRFENQTFTKDVTIDNNEFTGCTIKDCTVFFGGGNFSLEHTQLINVRFGFSDAAKNTLAFLKIMRAASPQLIDELLNQGRQPDLVPVVVPSHATH